MYSQRLKVRAELAAAPTYRQRLNEVAFVGITGSCGKTTTKELVAAVLGAHLQGKKTPGGENELHTIAKTILATRRGDKFCVAEVAAWSPGTVARAARLLRPQIAVVTNVGRDHRQAYRTLTATAREKAALVEAVSPGGTAVLNADDPHVAAMADLVQGRIITFGLSPGAMLRASDVKSSWPGRLTFTLHHESRSVRVSTRLCGKHWVSSVLAALAVAVAMKIPLETAIAAAAAMEPYPGRMSPVCQDGITFIRDDFKAPLWAIDAAIEFLAEAQASRKVMILGTISDYGPERSRAYRSVARRAAAAADEVVFVGPHAGHVLKIADGLPLRAFATVREAAAYLQEELREGDLVLLKGSKRADHLLRIILALTGEVGCWRAACGRDEYCDQCSLLTVPEEVDRLDRRASIPAFRRLV